MSADQDHRPGELLQVTKIAMSNPDSYAVIHTGRWAFPCSRAWFERNRPAVGGYIDVDGATGRRVFVPADRVK